MTAAFDAITFAAPLGGGTLAKSVTVDAGRITGKGDPGHPRHFRFREQPIHGLRSLMGSIWRAAQAGEIAIRARPLAPTGRRAVYPCKRTNESPGLAVQPRRWVGLDFDSIPLNAGLPPELRADPAEWPDPLRQPELGVEQCLRVLPPEFRNVSAGWQITASAGVKMESWKIRLWFWLDRPATGSGLKMWLDPAIKKGLLDGVTLVEAQPHYLAVRAIGGNDPCPRRFGIIEGERAEVTLPDLDAMKRQQEQQERERAAPLEELRSGWSGRTGDWRTGTNPAAETCLANCIATMRADAGADFKELARKARYFASLCDADPDLVHGDLLQAAARARIDQSIRTVASSAAGNRHPTYMSEAARALAINEKYHLDDWADIKRQLRAAYVSTLTPQEAAQREATSTDDVLAWLEGRAG